MNEVDIKSQYESIAKDIDMKYDAMNNIELSIELLEKGLERLSIEWRKTNKCECELLRIPCMHKE